MAQEQQPSGAVFDPETHRFIDISGTAKVNQEKGRPFEVERGTLPDNTYKDVIVETHTHVGTHVEGGAHFYGKPGDDPDISTLTEPDEWDHRSIAEYPLDTFYGPGVLFPVSEPHITVETCEEHLEGVIEPGDIVVARNDSEVDFSKEDAYSDNSPPIPAFTEEAAHWLADYDIDGLVVGGVLLGDSLETNDHVHDILMSQGAVFIELVEGLDEITTQRFTAMALPYKVEDVGSSFCRAVVIEER